MLGGFAMQLDCSHNQRWVDGTRSSRGLEIPLSLVIPQFLCCSSRQLSAQLFVLLSNLLRFSSYVQANTKNAEAIGQAVS